MGVVGRVLRMSQMSAGTQGDNGTCLAPVQGSDLWGGRQGQHLGGE
jgi:hypothetical protein